MLVNSADYKLPTLYPPHLDIVMIPQNCSTLEFTMSEAIKEAFLQEIVFLIDSYGGHFFLSCDMHNRSKSVKHCFQVLCSLLIANCLPILDLHLMTCFRRSPTRKLVWVSLCRQHSVIQRCGSKLLTGKSWTRESRQVRHY